MAFWSWSAMAFFGSVYLLFVSPFAAAGFAFFMRDEWSESAFHRWAVRICVVYAGAVFLLDFVWITWSITHKTSNPISEPLAAPRSRFR
jgi:amino acid transporter